MVNIEMINTNILHHEPRGTGLRNKTTVKKLLEVRASTLMHDPNEKPFGEIRLNGEVVLYMKTSTPMAPYWDSKYEWIFYN